MIEQRDPVTTMTGHSSSGHIHTVYSNGSLSLVNEKYIGIHALQL